MNTLLHANIDKGAPPSSSFSEADSGKPVVWVHADSADDFMAVIPVARRLASEQGLHILLTVPSAQVKARMLKVCVRYISEEAGKAMVLPADTLSEATSFIERTRPTVALLATVKGCRYYLLLLRANSIPSFLISSRTDAHPSMLFKWYGVPDRQLLGCLSHIFVLDGMSEASLRKHGISGVSFEGNPIMDEDKEGTMEDYHDDIVERFVFREKAVFVASNIDTGKDLRLVASLSNSNPQLKCIFLPHTISEEHLNRIKFELEGHALLYSECDECTDFADVQILVADMLGAARRMYRYATLAYLGGGFSDYLPNVFEPLAYNLPIALGNRAGRKTIYRALKERGICAMVSSPKDLRRWVEAMLTDRDLLLATRLAAERYVCVNRGVVGRICSIISGCL